MGFFDKLKEAFESTSKEVTKVTKKVVNASKIQSQINEEERAVRDAYIEIGKKFYEAHRDEENEFAELCSQITGANERIEALTVELEKAKGMQRCPGCGTPVAIENAFCPKCGTKMPEIVVEEPEEEAEAADEAAEEPEAEEAAEAQEKQE